MFFIEVRVKFLRIGIDDELFGEIIFLQHFD